jgi:hypothetical protein
MQKRLPSYNWGQSQWEWMKASSYFQKEISLIVVQYWQTLGYREGVWIVCFLGFLLTVSLDLPAWLSHAHLSNLFLHDCPPGHWHARQPDLLPSLHMPSLLPMPASAPFMLGVFCSMCHECPFPTPPTPFPSICLEKFYLSSRPQPSRPVLSVHVETYNIVHLQEFYPLYVAIFKNSGFSPDL